MLPGVLSGFFEKEQMVYYCQEFTIEDTVSEGIIQHKVKLFSIQAKKKSIFIIPEPITTYLCATLAPRMLVQITVQSD